MADTLKEIKSIIKSILTSSPLLSTITTVQRDYRELVGNKIPVHDLKYNSVEQFLKNIPDICLVIGTGPFAQVFPVLSEKSAHVDLMVSKQKVNTKRRSVPIRRNIPVQFRNKRSSINAPLCYPSTSKSNYNSDTKSTLPKMIENGHCYSYSNAGKTVGVEAESWNIELYKESRHETIKTPPCSQKYNYNSYYSNCNTMSNRVENGHYNSYSNAGKTLGVKQENRNIELHKENRPEKIQVSPSSKSAIPDNAPVLNQEDLNQFNTNIEIEKTLTNLNNLNFKDLHEKYENTSNVPLIVQNNLKKLISQFEDGIWCSELPGHYKKLYKLDLLYMDYGYTSLIDMCVVLTNIFHYIRPGKDDFKLYDRSKPPPVLPQRNCTISSLNTGDMCSQSISNPLPDLDWSDFSGYIPKDIFEIGNEIPKEFLPENTQDGDELDVVVVEIYDPSKFWIYFGTSEHKTPLDQLMDEIQNFYNDKDNQKDYGIPPGIIQEGLYCVQIIFGEYHRAKIIKILPDTQDVVKVFFIDYGTVRKVPIKGMCFLHSQFALLPAQAVRCRLTNIAPHIKGSPWTRSSSDKFRELVNRRDTKIKISYINWSEEYICVFLADITNPKKVVYINEVLVKNGFAVWEDEAKAPPPMLPNLQCKVQKLHLFPTFLELEYGLAPNAAEMYSLENLLIPIQFCIPQYFESASEVQQEETDMEHMERCLVDTVKYRRHFPKMEQVNTSLILDPPLDFDVFGDLKEELSEFYTNLNIQAFEDEVCEAATIDIVQITESMRQYDQLKLIKEDMVISENIMKNLDALYPTKATALSQSEIIEREIASIFDDIDDHLMMKPIFKYNARKTKETNVDNPESFDNILRKRAKSPVQPSIFLQIVETLTKSGAENTTQNNLLGKDNFNTAFNMNSNPFTSSCNPFTSSSSNIDFLNLSVPEINLEQELNDLSVDLIKDVLLDVSKINKMPILCQNNPFYNDVENLFVSNTDESLSVNCSSNTAHDKIEPIKLEPFQLEHSQFAYSSGTSQLDNVSHRSNSISTQTSDKDMSLETTQDMNEDKENSTEVCIVSKDIPKTDKIDTESVNSIQKSVTRKYSWWSHIDGYNEQSQKCQEVNEIPGPPSEYPRERKEGFTEAYTVSKDVPNTEHVITEPVNNNQMPVTRMYTQWSNADKSVQHSQKSQGVNTIPQPPSGYQPYESASKDQGISTSSQENECSSTTNPEVDSNKNVRLEQQQFLHGKSQNYFTPPPAFGPQPFHYIPWSNGYQIPQFNQWSTGSNAAVVSPVHIPSVRPPPGYPSKNNNYYTPVGTNMIYTSYPSPTVYYPPPNWQCLANHTRDFYYYYNNYLTNVIRKQM